MKERESSFELLRIIAMTMIVLVHTNYSSLGEVLPLDVLSSPVESWWKIFVEQLCIVGVNVFILISGWFGIKPTLKGASSIFFQVLFYGVLLYLIGCAIDVPIKIRELFRVLYFGGHYWFIIAYIGLYVFAPVLNAFVDNTQPQQQLMVLISFFSLELLFGWVINIGTYAKGYSTLSFIGLYLLARILRVNQESMSNCSCKKYLALYFIMTLIPAFLAFLGLKYTGSAFCNIYYSSPFVIAASTFLFLAFTKLHFKNNIVNWVAASVFSIYFVHQHPVAVPVFISTMKHAYAELPGLLYVLFAIGITLLLGTVCVLFDKVRIAIWNLLCKHGLDNFFGKVSSLTQRL